MPQQQQPLCVAPASGVSGVGPLGLRVGVNRGTLMLHQTRPLSGSLLDQDGCTPVHNAHSTSDEPSPTAVRPPDTTEPWDGATSPSEASDVATIASGGLGCNMQSQRVRPGPVYYDADLKMWVVTVPQWGSRHLLFGCKYSVEKRGFDEAKRRAVLAYEHFLEVSGHGAARPSVGVNNPSMFFSRAKDAWCTQWYEGTKRIFKSFSCRVYGPQAELLCRWFLDAVKRQGCRPSTAEVDAHFAHLRRTASTAVSPSSVSSQAASNNKSNSSSGYPTPLPQSHHATNSSYTNNNTSTSNYTPSLHQSNISNICSDNSNYKNNSVSPLNADSSATTSTSGSSASNSKATKNSKNSSTSRHSNAAANDDNDQKPAAHPPRQTTRRGRRSAAAAAAATAASDNTAEAGPSPADATLSASGGTRVPTPRASSLRAATPRTSTARGTAAVAAGPATAVGKNDTVPERTALSVPTTSTAAASVTDSVKAATTEAPNPVVTSMVHPPTTAVPAVGTATAVQTSLNMQQQRLLLLHELQQQQQQMQRQQLLQQQQLLLQHPPKRRHTHSNSNVGDNVITDTSSSLAVSSLPLSVSSLQQTTTSAPFLYPGTAASSFFGDSVLLQQQQQQKQLLLLQQQHHMQQQLQQQQQQEQVVHPLFSPAKHSNIPPVATSLSTITDSTTFNGQDDGGGGGKGGREGESGGSRSSSKCTATVTATT